MVPAPVDGIEANACRNAGCSNVGVEPLLQATRGRLAKGQPTSLSDKCSIVGNHGDGRLLRRLSCMQCRLLMVLERPIRAMVSKQTWNGYAPDTAGIIQKLLAIFRGHYDYCKTEKKARKHTAGNPLPKRTPAMKLGLTKGLVRI